MRVCGLTGCDASLEHLRAKARYCSPAHRAMAHRGARLRDPGRCAECDARLTSTRATFCGNTCRWRAWVKGQRSTVKRLRTDVRGIQALSVPRCPCGSTTHYTDAFDGDIRCVTCGRTLFTGAVAA
jgi:hypothetical protein